MRILGRAAALGLVLLSAINASAAFLYVAINGTNPVPPYADWPFAATNIQDAVDAAVTGDSIVVSNGVYQTGGRVTYGALTNRVAVTKPVTLLSLNGPAVTVIQGNPVLGDTAVRCVYLTNGATLIGFTLQNGATRSLSSDLFLEQMGGGVWCETNGTSVLSNCVLCGNSAWSCGGGAYRATLQNCTLTNNLASKMDGGGAYNCVLSDCTLDANSAFSLGGGASASSLEHCALISNSAELGGGADSSTLNHCFVVFNSTVRFGMGGGANDSTLNDCIIVGNDAVQYGGGADGCTLNNCTLLGNWASVGGGVYSSTARNCIICQNTASSSGSNYSGGTLSYCCTAPLPNGSGNITNCPIFTDLVEGGFHPQSNSPCINAGNNAYAANASDLDGNPRIAGGTVDIGAYEFQAPTSLISYAWLQQYGWPTDGSVDFADPDGDGVCNWQEWRAGTDPTNPASALKMTCITNTPSGIRVQWQSLNASTYYVQRSTRLDLSSFVTLRSNIVGSLTGTSSYTDTNFVSAGPVFYRVGVQ
jgi:hypothetical protein